MYDMVEMLPGECVHDMAWRYREDIWVALGCRESACEAVAVNLLALLGWEREPFVLAYFSDDRGWLGAHTHA